MEPTFKKIILQPDDFSAGAGKMNFFGHERLADLPGIKYGNISSSRNVISLAGSGKKGNTARAGFELDKSFFSSPSRTCSHMLWMRGMWDHYKYLAAEFAPLGDFMPTIGHFRITINDNTVFDGMVYYWNYRRWRFWPCLELPVSESAFRPGCNELIIENLTGPFLEDMPEMFEKMLSASRSDDTHEVPAAIRENTTFNLSDIQILTRELSDLEVLNAPSVVRVGESFSIEVFATVKHDLELCLPSQLEMVSSNVLKPGRNQLWFKASAPKTDLRIRATCPTSGESLEVPISQCVDVPDSDEFLLGHIVGGHLCCFALDHDYRHIAELFRDTRQGNLLVWLMDPRKAGDYITAESLPIADIKAGGLKVAFRYYGEKYTKPFPPSLAYPGQVARCIKELGDAFVGLAPHEYGAFAARALDKTESRPDALKLFRQGAEAVINEMKDIAGDAPVWITDPSTYSSLYRKLGTNLAGLELFPIHCCLNAASVRGTCRMHDDTGWAAINSFECQAYGGLNMPEQMVELDEDFDTKRSNLWRLSQFHLYLSGARIIYSESGAFHQVFGRQMEFDYPQLCDFRQAQRDLLDFSQVHALSGQPLADFAFVKSDDDLFSDLYVPASQQGDSTWQRLRTAWPNMQWKSGKLRDSTVTTNDRPHYSDTPYGEADIVSIQSPPEMLQQYKALTLVGEHCISEQQAQTLQQYVSNGGQVIVSLADFLDDSLQPTRGEPLSKLCGVRLSDETEKSFLREVSACGGQDIAQDICIPCCPSPEAYGGLVMGNLKLDKSAEAILADAFSKEPFLVANRIGNGKVWLINSVYYHDNGEYLQLVNWIVRSVFEQIPVQLKILDGVFTNSFVYRKGGSRDCFHHVFVLNNDWFSRTDIHEASFEYEGLKFTVNVPRKNVAQFFLADDLVIIPSHDKLRLDKVSSRDNVTTICLQGIGCTDIELRSKRKIRAVEISSADNHYSPIEITSDSPSETKISPQISGACRIRVIF